tara:strand:- start:5165 stop:5344 length:180 start_codon:yes stop_codon:yes gene_type:complete
MKNFIIYISPVDTKLNVNQYQLQSESMQSALAAFNELNFPCRILGVGTAEILIALNQFT